MNAREFIFPSWEKLIFLLLVAIAANFPLIGSYHTELVSTYCLQNKIANCQQTMDRELHLNPIFWFPYILNTGSDSLGKSLGGNDDMRIPGGVLLPQQKFLSISLTILYWYLATCMLVFPFSTEKKDKYYD